ncbi:MAG TPA: aldose epimerase family protein, partial [bacterium]|nr:aldose epimerase family protein [bacterium]
ILPDGKKSALFRLGNSAGFQAEISNLGGAVVSLLVPARDGDIDDLVLGFDSLREYQTNPPHFGVIIGRYANRIAYGKFTLHGKTYRLAQNHGDHHLHGGDEGFDKKIWAAEEVSGDDSVGLKLSYVSKDGEEGYPGKLSVTVTYQVTEENELIIDYFAVTDKSTILNLTNHSYFNLTGAGSGNILDHIAMINADAFTPVADENAIPTGKFRSVEGTPLDFRNPAAIGERIESEYEQIRYGEGYDHNYVLNGGDAEPGLAARVTDPASGRQLEVFTTEPGMQFYTANHLDGTLSGKQNAKYHRRDAFCLETQHFPDAPNRPEFPSTELNPEEEFHSTTIYKFSQET